jgi:hypothetical protein
MPALHAASLLCERACRSGEGLLARLRARFPHHTSCSSVTPRGARHGGGDAGNEVGQGELGSEVWFLPSRVRRHGRRPARHLQGTGRTNKAATIAWIVIFSAKCPRSDRVYFSVDGCIANLPGNPSNYRKEFLRRFAAASER